MKTDSLPVPHHQPQGVQPALRLLPPTPRKKDFMGDFVSGGAFAKLIEQSAELQNAQLQQLQNGSSTTPQGKCAECASCEHHNLAHAHNNATSIVWVA